MTDLTFNIRIGDLSDGTDPQLVLGALQTHLQTMLSDVDDSNTATVVVDVGDDVSAYAIVQSSGGVVQDEEFSDDVLLITIDWDEIDETEEEVALEYAVRVLGWIGGLPDKQRKSIENTVHESLERRGYPTPVARDMEAPVLCSERLDDDCHVIYDEASGDGYMGECPACADKKYAAENPDMVVEENLTDG